MSKTAVLFKIIVSLDNWKSLTCYRCDSSGCGQHRKYADIFMVTLKPKTESSHSLTKNIRVRNLFW